MQDEQSGIKKLPQVGLGVSLGEYRNPTNGFEMETGILKSSPVGLRRSYLAANPTYGKH